MAPLFRRRSADVAVAPEPEPQVTVPVVHSRAYTPKKGEATPKRPGAGRRPEPPPADRREAAKRVRERQRVARAEARAGMMSGDERYLLPRDKGPVRGLARDIVDSRRNAATFFFIGLFVVLLGSSQAFPPAVQIGANVLFVVLLAATLLDTVLIVRRVRRLAAERFPKVTEGNSGLYFYVAMRTISFRRLRVPKPRVRVGDTV